MEISSARHLVSFAGAEKYEMLELNRRLESYLNHVKLLEEENQLLWEEIQAMRKNQNTGGQRKAQEEALSLARKEVLIAWREKDHVELEFSNMLEEIEELNKLRQKEKTAKVEVDRKLAESRKVLEDEKRMQSWLKKQAAHLENEISLQVQVHQDDMAALKSSGAFSKPVLIASQHTQTLNLQGLGEEYSQRAAQAWREAAGVYQTQMKKLEVSVDQTRAHMTLIKQEKKESQLQVHDLAKELESTKAKRELLEKNMVQQRQRQNQDLRYLQANVESLEAEKLELGEQIGELLVESRNLLQTKMSLNLEVATYRALLDNESLRVNDQSASKRNRTVSHLEGFTKSPGISPGTQTISSCLFSSPLNITSQSITHKAYLMTSTPTKSLTPRTPQETPKSLQTTKEEDVIVRVEKQNLETSAAILKNLNGEGSHDHYRAEEEASYTDSVDSSIISNTVDEPQSILSKNVKDDLQEAVKADVEQVLLSTNETAMITSLAGHPQTPESSPFSQHIEEAKRFEDGDEEETEVSTEIAQISHAPVSAWEENETVIPDSQDVFSGQELESGDIAENCTEEFKMDSDHSELQLLGENPNTPASLLLQEIPPLSADTFSPFEDDSEILTWADVKEDVIYFVEEESLKSAPELEKESVKETEEVKETMEVEAEWPGVELLEGHEFDIKLQEGKHETEPEKKGTQKEKEELINVEEEKMIKDKIEETFGEQKAELIMNTYEKVHLVGENAESVMDTDEKDNLEGEKAKALVNPFDKEHTAEEEQRQSDEDESLNISASWRTDPGEADSYAQENTLADTRPLIHYRSDEETDANMAISHLGVNEPTESDKETEKPEGGSHWSEIIAKRFDTMEDLSEEPELGSMDDIDTEGSVQTVLRESIDEEFVAQNESGDMDGHGKTLTDDGLVDQSESGLRSNSNENSQGDEKTEIENYHLSACLVEKQGDSVQLYNESETRQIKEQQTPTNNSEDAMTENRNNTENLKVESLKGESEDKKYFNTPLPEPFQEQVPAEELYEGVSTEITPSDEPLFRAASTEEPVCPKEQDVQPNLSVITHADFTDELSLQSHPENQTNTTNSDLEEPNSSEDESSNASQCSQLLSQSEMLIQQLDTDNMTTMDVVSNPDPSFTGLFSGIQTKESSEDYNAPKAEELENKEEQQHAVDSRSGGMGENDESLPQEWQNLGHEATSASPSIHSTAEDLDDLEMEDNKENVNIFQEVAPKEEDFQTTEKENDCHSFFSSSIKEGIWSATNFDMAATYDANDQTETERYSYDSIDPNQTMSFGKDWGNLERSPLTNSKPEKDMGTSITQSTEEEGQEQKTKQTKQAECRDVKNGDEENVRVEDSTDEGDSWSSGEE